MNCQEFWNMMPELAGAAAMREETLADRHLEGCPACAMLMTRQRALTSGLRALSGDMRHLEAPSGVEGRLQAAFRIQSLQHRLPQDAFPVVHAECPVWQRRVPVLTWAAAAAVIAVALFLVHDRQPEATRPPASRGIELAMLELPGEYEASDTDTSDTGGFVPFGFIPLPSAARISPSEDVNEAVNMVRVEVPRSSMIALGFQVSAERALEPIQAEVMLGADGTARAVRFLDE